MVPARQNGRGYRTGFRSSASGEFRICTSHPHRPGSKAVSTGLTQCARRDAIATSRHRGDAMPVTDRAAVVAEALVSEIVNVLTTTTVARTELRRRITEILRDEFAEERWQGVVDRTLPDP